MKTIIPTLAILATAGFANAQTINNGGFELYTDTTENGAYTSEINEGVDLKLGTITHWKHENDISINLVSTVTTETVKDPKTGKETKVETRKENSALRIGGLSEPQKNVASTGIAFSSAGTYTVAFDSFMIKKDEGSTVANVFISSEDSNLFLKEFTEKSDGQVTAQSFEFVLTDKAFEKTAGKLTFGFNNAGGSKAAHDMLVDNVSVTAVPEPSSTALLGLGALGLLARRKR